MPEVEQEKNLKPHRQCEIRRPSPPSTLRTNQHGIGAIAITKPAGYYFDVVWIENDLARVGARLVGNDGNEWLIAETYGSRPMPRSSRQFTPAPR